MANSIKVRASAKGGTTTVKTLISHPMQVERKDKKTGKVKPAHFIQEVVCEHNGKSVLTASWGAAISKNPYLSFKFKGAKKGDSLKISWVDNKGGKDSTVAKVK